MFLVAAAKRLRASAPDSDSNVAPCLDVVLADVPAAAAPSDALTTATARGRLSEILLHKPLKSDRRADCRVALCIICSNSY